MTKNEQDRKMRIIGISSILILWSLCGSAQNSNAIDISLQKYSPVSPEAASLIRYVECPVDLAHGLVPIEIPIFEIKMDGVRLPISLSYHSGGIKVQDQGGIIGLGWSLNADPSVTRTVQGKPDESSNGYLYNSDFGNTTDNYLRLLANSSADEDPDAFYYKLAERSGGFYLDRFNSNAAHLFPPANVKASFGHSQITIWDEDGTVYEFGGYTDFLEKNIVGGDGDYISRWAANRIRSAESGREITFQHTLGSDFTNVSLPAMSSSVSIEVKDNRVGIISETIGSLTQNFTWDNINKKMEPDPASSGPSFRSGSQMNHTTVKRRFLTAINFPEGRVVFEYTHPRLLHKISIYNKQGLIKEARMFYDCYNTSRFTSPRYLMDSLQITNSKGQVEERYHFEYDRPYDLPDIYSTGVDHWGYYNGARNETLVPSFSFTTYYHQVNYPGGNRNTYEDYMKIGSLKRIRWPGGRKTDFHYGANEYGIHIPSEPNERVITGGLRIETIKESDDSWSSWRYFSYEEPLYDGSMYYGKPKILINTDLYCVEREKATQYDSISSKLYTWYCNPVPNLFFSNGSPVAYETVHEIRHDGEEDEWKFTYRYSVSDPVRRTDLKRPFYPEPINYSSDVKMTEMEESYNTGEISWNGQPIFKKVRHKKYEYDMVKSSSAYFRKAYNYRILPAYNPNNVREDFKTVFSSYYLAYRAPIKETVTEYPATGASIATVKEYKYNGPNPPPDHLFPVKVMTRQSDGTSITEQFFYPHDMMGSFDLGQQGLIDSWKINALLEHRHPQMTVRNAYSGTKLQTVLSNTGANQSFEPRLHYEYDAYGNPQCAYIAGGTKTVYLWSYNHQLPVAVIESSGWQEVVNGLGGQAVVDEIAAKEYPTQQDMNLMNGLRQTLPNALVTTYVHKPLVGVILITDPAGRKINYEYDPAGRLMRVTDKDGNILSAHRYNLVLPK